MKRRHALLWMVALCAAGPVFGDEGQREVTFDRWYALTLMNQPVGWAHERVAREGEEIASTSAMNLSLRRGAIVLGIEMENTFVETPEGKPIRARVLQKMGAATLERVAHYGDESIELVTSENGRETRKTLPLPKEAWHTPADAGRLVEEKLEAGEKAFTISLMDPSTSLSVFETTWKFQGEEDVEVYGKVTPATLWHITASNVPGVVTRAYVDAKGHMVKTTVTLMPGLELVMLEADEQLATAKVNPPELMRSTLVEPNKPIGNPRQSRMGMYQLTFTEPADVEDYSPQLPRGGFQRVVWGDRLTAKVVVNLDDPVNPENDLPTDAHRQASGVLDSDDPEVKQLVAKALDGSPEAKSEKAERLRRFVHEYIQAKDLSVGFATAGEVARTRQGDCSEHGVLLAAMLRGAGIPSRTVSGLIYVDRFLGRNGVFGYHMWTQAWLDIDGGGGRWVDLDATLGNDTPFDATHIALGSSSHADDTMMNDMISMAAVLGRIKIEVVDVEAGR